MLILMQNLCFFVTALILLYVDQLPLLFFKQCLLGMKLYFPIDKIAFLFLFLILFYISHNFLSVIR